MISVRLTNIKSDPWTHVELPLLDENGNQQTDEQGNPLWQQFHAGDIVQVSPETAEHLVMSMQGEELDSESTPVMNEQGLPDYQAPSNGV